MDINDCWYFNSSGPCLYVGGNYGRSTGLGLFFVYGTYTSYTYASIGCRLMEI